MYFTLLTVINKSNCPVINEIFEASMLLKKNVIGFLTTFISEEAGSTRFGTKQNSKHLEKK